MNPSPPPDPARSVDDLPAFPEPDRLMSSVMSMAQQSVDRVEQYRAGIALMIASETTDSDGWRRGWGMLKALYGEPQE